MILTEKFVVEGVEESGRIVVVRAEYPTDYPDRVKAALRDNARLAFLREHPGVAYEEYAFAAYARAGAA